MGTSTVTESVGRVTGVTDLKGNQDLSDGGSGSGPYLTTDLLGRRFLRFTGASTADLAVILIDARKGVLVQTRRHSYLAHLIGIRHLVLPAVGIALALGLSLPPLQAAVLVAFAAMPTRFGYTLQPGGA